MNILLLGSGGREHALAWAVGQNPKCARLFIAPGNTGMKQHGICLKDIDICNILSVLKCVEKHKIDFVIVGPEAPLAAGICDDLRAKNILCLGPDKAGALLESSKAFTKKICDEADIPTAPYRAFNNVADARAYIAQKGAPIVIKADGLAAGKGVYIAQDVESALRAVNDIFENDIGGVSKNTPQLVIEEFIQGQEASLFVLVNGLDAMPIGTAQDHKRAYDGDRGPNTGGMGAYSPSPIMNDALIDSAMHTIIYPTLKTLVKRKTPYQGVLYAGLMIENSRPRLVEYNVRFGDPECQVLMMRLGAQILDLMLACAENRLDKIDVNWVDDHALTVVIAAKGYPGHYTRGEEIKGIEHAATDIHEMCFSAGLQSWAGKFFSAGGRVLNVTARAEKFEDAHAKVYAMVEKIDWKGGFYRRDIGATALKDAD